MKKARGDKKNIGKEEGGKKKKEKRRKEKHWCLHFW